MTRSGSEYLEGLRDGRVVWLGARRIDGIEGSREYGNAAETIAGLYDSSASEKSQGATTYLDEQLGTRCHRSFLIPRSHADLVSKRGMHKAWAARSFGFMGRSPDYMASALAGFASRSDVFAGGEFDGSGNVKRLYERAAKSSLYLSFAITNLKVDRRKSLSQQTPAQDIGVRVLKQTDAGIRVSGVKSVGTAAIFSDEIVVGTIEPMSELDIDYALTFHVAPAAPGVSLVSRPSYEASATSDADNPLSHRFDENDALLVLDDVFIPWEQVLVFRDVRRNFAIWWDTPAYTNMAHQASIRFWTKLEFLAGLASLVIESNGLSDHPQTRERLGSMLSHVQIARSIVLAAEAAHHCEPGDDGVRRLDKNIVYAQRAFAADVYPKFLHELRMLCGSSLIQLPRSVSDLDAPEIGEVLRRSLQTADSSASQRVRLMRLVWDATCSEFASRHAHYEQFYQGAPHAYLAQMTFTGAAQEFAGFAAQALRVEGSIEVQR